MKILFISPTPPDHLNRIRSLNIVSALSEEHDIHLVCFVNSYQDLNNLDQSLYAKVTPILQSKTQSYLNCLIRSPIPEPLEAAYCYSHEMEKTIKEIVALENIDMVYVKRTRMARYGLLCSNVITILDLTDSMEMHYGRTLKTVVWYKKPLYIEEWLKYRYYERNIVHHYDKCVVCSGVDKQFLENRTNARNIYVVPNIVNTNVFSPQPNILETSHTLMFSGLMNKQVNIDGAKFLLDEIYPLIRQHYPDVKLYIVGPNPPSYLQEYTKQDTNIIVTGYVSDIRKYIARSSVVLVPIRVGAGTRNKILQAMAMKKPVVSTTIGAEGLIGITEDTISIADEPTEFAKKVITLLSDGKRRMQIANAGYVLVKQNYGMNALKQSLKLVIS